MTPFLTFVVFSKDRPFQLHGLLRSLFRHCREQIGVFVLYAASTDRLLVQYHQALSSLKGLGMVHAIVETYPFADHVNTILSWVHSPYTAFLVDDIVFTRPFRPSDLRRELRNGAIASLRLGNGIDYSYMTDGPMTMPALRSSGALLRWRWNQGSIDWCYPMSVDGNIFATAEIIRTVASISFHSPNSLEARLNDIAPPFRKRRAVSFRQPVLINIPANKVQTDLPGNRSGSLTTEELATLWDEGLCLDVARYDDLESHSVHVECELFSVSRVSVGASR